MTLSSHLVDALASRLAKVVADEIRGYVAEPVVDLREPLVVVLEPEPVS